MKARALGRFVAEFLEGLAGGKDTAEEAAPSQPAPIVVPVEMVRQAVAEFLKPMVDAAAAEEPAPTGQQLDMMFDDARPPDPSDIADLAMRRAAQMQADAEAREQAARNNGAVPETYDPNSPGEKKWMAAQVSREAVERSAG
jgi:hypothetical protein